VVVECAVVTQKHVDSGYPAFHDIKLWLQRMHPDMIGSTPIWVWGGTGLFPQDMEADELSFPRLDYLNVQEAPYIFIVP
jgi:hypothetical protein